ncbi:hypothetical protein ABN764_27620 [Paenibacillaceae sp. P-4]
MRYASVSAGADRIGLLLVLLLIVGMRNVFLQQNCRDKRTWIRHVLLN